MKIILSHLRLYPNAAYSFDTSAFIEPWRRHYQPDIFGAIWNQIKELLLNRRILVTLAVKDELEKQRDELFNFINRINPFLQPTRDEQRIVRQLINHPNFDKWGLSDEHHADPFVVALAKCNNLAVVAYENIRATKNKIPVACKMLDVEYIEFPEFLRRENITFP
ncbi:MAG: DUF4411 family protein [Candidatus Helarchaeota archaeon]